MTLLYTRTLPLLPDEDPERRRPPPTPVQDVTMQVLG
jgi:hypothetical protein